ncbi:MAG: hypothetical protein K2X39_02545, partial [Silvanigrellaceae bacterium]|nr:hypothetical protein [Silvanigrellaceae bacterium]
MNFKKKLAHLFFLLFPGKTFDFKLKKIPYYIAICALAGCASIVIGLLSFGGMLAISPLVSLAIGSALLAVAYEGEIYLKNIQATWNKVFKSKYIERSLAKKFLFEHFPDVTAKDCPQFFKDYKAQWEFVHKLNHNPVEGEALKIKKQAEKTLKDLEKMFADALFSTDELENSNYKQAL